VVGGELRVNSAAWNTAAVGTATPGNSTRYQESAPRETDVSLSPTPSAHADRPALIMVNQGQIFEYSSKCTVPIVHKAGEIARESNGLMHWWKNEGNVVVVLTIADIVNDKKPDSMMPMM
jgi:hypothetical protein